MKIVKDKIEITELNEMSKKMFGNLVKAVVDIEKGIMAVDAELHVDLEQFLIEQGLEPKDLWGINIHPQKNGDEYIEFDSMINLKPALNNRTRGIESSEIRQKIIKIVNSLVKK
ncbi:MAG: hypothetical protein HY005_00715 [Candidatus Staskawiczbacteria bacterium]|nr:hypothetical protein [Candidatus Staskawiczbacteria bacterium]MBI3337130.1 hypothetical protein [Candidatus Staskawiczbacteria bacterium]